MKAVEKRYTNFLVRYINWGRENINLLPSIEIVTLNKRWGVNLYWLTFSVEFEKYPPIK